MMDMEQVYSDSDPKFETCLECRPVVGMLKDRHIEGGIIKSERARAANLRERIRIQDWLKQHRTAKRHGTRLMESSSSATQDSDATRRRSFSANRRLSGW